MKQRVVTEYVEFRTVSGTDEETFIGIVDQLERQFHSNKAGFIDTELCRIGEGHWAMIQHWATPEDAKSAICQMMKAAITEAFRSSIDPKTVKMQLMERYGTW